MIHLPKRKRISASLHVPANDIVAPRKIETSELLPVQSFTRMVRIVTLNRGSEQYFLIPFFIPTHRDNNPLDCDKIDVRFSLFVAHSQITPLL